MNRFTLVACLAALACGCQQQQTSSKPMDEDQNFQGRRKEMKQTQTPYKVEPAKKNATRGGCCEVEKPAAVEVEKQSAAVLEAKPATKPSSVAKAEVNVKLQEAPKQEVASSDVQIEKAAE